MKRISQQNKIMKKNPINWVSLILVIISQTPMITLAQNLTVEQKEGQKCWVIKSDNIELAITQKGGHMAPVTFYRKSNNPVAPYYISPWQNENHAEFPAEVLVPLRGDFFCLPFGGNGDVFNGEKHEPHGESATAHWDLQEVQTDSNGSRLVLTMDTKVRKGKLTKTLHLKNSENVIYSTHTIEGFAGKTPLGHHATLAMPDETDAFSIHHSPIKFGMTNPGVFSNPENREYQQMAIGAEFQSLSRIPSIYQGRDSLDGSKLPREKGFADLFLITQKPSDSPAWTAAINSKENWMWFSFKNAEVLSSTVFWLENGGRHGFPWDGRNNCVGIEDVTAFFADGLVPSMKENVLTKKGVSTTVELTDEKPTHIHYIQGVTKIPEQFEDIESVEFNRDNTVTFTSSNGISIHIKAQWDFVLNGNSK